jgi:hypothetical protein
MSSSYKLRLGMEKCARRQPWFKAAKLHISNRNYRRNLLPSLPTYTVPTTSPTAATSLAMSNASSQACEKKSPQGPIPTVSKRFFTVQYDVDCGVRVHRSDRPRASTAYVFGKFARRDARSGQTILRLGVRQADLRQNAANCRAGDLTLPKRGENGR